jgi:opacity protein-like surface antigen
MFSAGPFVRYFFADLGEKAKLFGQGQFTFGSEKASGEDESVSFTGWDVGVGLAYFFNHNVALEAELGYGSEKPSDHNGVVGIANNTFGLKIGFQIELGGEH